MKIKFIILLIIILLLNIRLLYLYNYNDNNINKSINKIKLNNNHIIERFALGDPPAGKQWSAKGCFFDSEERIIPNFKSELTPAECYAKALAAGDSIVGFQFGEGVGGGKAQCWTGPATTDYARLGPSTGCSVTNNKLGAAWANNVFVLEDIPRAEQARSTTQEQARNTTQEQARSTNQEQARSTTQEQARSTTQANNDLPISEIIVLNRKYTEPIQEPDLTNILCDDTNVCFSHLRFNYPKY
jgi:hypothetical protein